MSSVTEKSSLEMLTLSAGIVIGVCLILQQQKTEAAHFLNPICGVSYESYLGTRITNGKEAVLRSAPFMAYLTHNNKFHGGGSIISSRYILTAAHCLLRNLKVRLGEHDITTIRDCQGSICNPASEEYDIIAAFRHRHFNNITLAHDIGLLKLHRSINFNEHIQPICLLLNPASASYVREFQAFGWGLTTFNQHATVLQTTVLTRYDSNYCRRALLAPVTDNQICAGFDDTDTCEGDSGGPLVTKLDIDGVNRYVQLGIVSFGPTQCRSPAIYTYVPNYIRWIQQTMRAHDSIH